MEGFISMSGKEKRKPEETAIPASAGIALRVFLC